MASPYVGKKCPHCGVPFTADDAIHVCPTCRMPHHRACWGEHGGCATSGCPERDFAPRPAAAPAPAPPPQASPSPAPAPTEAIPAEAAAEAPLVVELDTPPPATRDIPPLDPAVTTLLAEVRQRIGLGEYTEASTRLETIKGQAPEHPAVLEMEGDLTFALGRFRQALESYRQAHEADPKNAVLEEKFATALVKVHEPEMLSHIPDDDDWGPQSGRKPWASALRSLLLPGLGQIYNGEVIKGGIVLTVSVILAFVLLGQLLEIFQPLQAANRSEPITIILGQLVHRSHGIVPLFSTVIWLYGIVDAAVVAYRNRN